MNIVLDIESADLAINTKIHFVGAYTEANDREYFRVFTLPAMLPMFAKFIEENKLKKSTFAFYNGKFDTARILYSYGIDVPIGQEVMYLVYLMSTVDEMQKNRGKWLGLKYAAPRILGVENWDIGEDKTSTDLEVVRPYLRLDCKYTYKLLEKLLPSLPENKKKTYFLMLKAANAYKHIEQTGLPIDMDMLAKVRDEYFAKKTVVDAKLLSYSTINFNSTTQLQKLLFEDLGLPVNVITDTGQPSTGYEALLQLKGVHPIIEPLLEKRDIEKVLAFLTAWEEKAIQHPDGKSYLHSNFNIHGTVTGRTSSSEVNLQQVPRNKTLKNMFHSMDPDWELVQFDFSQLELRFAALVANIAAMKESYRNGEDLHTRMASNISGKPVEQITKVERTSAKAANFGFLYGMGSKSFVEYAATTYGVTISQAEAETVRNTYFRTYPELLSYYKRVDDAIINTLSQDSIMSRVYNINSDALVAKRERSDFLRAAKNWPVQSAASDYVLCGVIELFRNSYIRDNFRVCCTVHDSVVGLVKKNNSFYDTIRLIKETLEHPKLAEKFLTIPIDIPLIVDVEIGPWGSGISPEEHKKATTKPEEEPLSTYEKLLRGKSTTLAPSMPFTEDATGTITSTPLGSWTSTTTVSSGMPIGTTSGLTWLAPIETAVTYGGTLSSAATKSYVDASSAHPPTTHFDPARRVVILKRWNGVEYEELELAPADLAK